MSSGPDEVDPFADLRESFDPAPSALTPAPVSPSGASAFSTPGSLAFTASSTSGHPSPPSMPPPLPRRNSGTNLPRAETSPTPAPIASRGNDPFHEGPEPRPPKGSSPEEKLDYVRTLVKLKTETLARARSMYSERELETDSLRQTLNMIKVERDELRQRVEQLEGYSEKYIKANEAAERDRGRAEKAEGKLAHLVLQLDENEHERKDLTRALAEVEVQIPHLSGELATERSSRAQLAEALIDAKEALAKAQAEVAQLATSHSEDQGALQAVQARYQEQAEESERFEAEASRLREEVETLSAERDAAVTERDVVRTELESTTERVRSLEGEAEWSQSSLESAQAEARQRGDEREELARRGAELEETLATLETQLRESAGAREAAEETVAALESQLRETAGSRDATDETIRAIEQQLREANEALEAEREARIRSVSGLQSTIAELEGERQALTERLSSVETDSALAQGRSEELEDTVRELEARLRDVDAARAAAEQERSAQEEAASTLNSQLAELQGEREALLERVSTLETQLDTLETKAGGQATKVSEQVARKDTEIFELRKALKAFETALAERDTLLRREQETRVGLEAQVGPLRAEAAKGRELAAMQQRNAELARELLAVQQRNAEVQQMYKAAQGSLEAARKEGAGSAGGADQAELAKERAARAQLETEARQWDAAYRAEKERADALEMKLATGGGGGGASSAEVEKLRADVVSLRKKLGAAETAMEAAASLRQKVARLEAQLKSK